MTSEEWSPCFGCSGMAATGVLNWGDMQMAHPSSTLAWFNLDFK